MTGTNGLQHFYQVLTGDDIKAVAASVNITDIRTGFNNPVGYSSVENGENRPTDISTANTNVSPTINGSNTIFALSVAEYNSYKNIIQTHSDVWWLRTPGNSAEKQSAYVHSDGNLNNVGIASSSYNDICYVPAIWVRS
jgi:hypothetical protein